MRLLRRLIILGVLVTVLPLLASLGYARFWVEPDTPEPASAIIILSGPGALQTGVIGQTKARVDRGIALFQAGIAPRIIMTGGSPGEISAARVMMDYALTRGVAQTLISIEPASRSTLQNAEFVARMAPELQNAPVIIVTHRYHMLRSRASFWWAGFSDVQSAMPDPQGIPLTRHSLTEAIKWPLNTLRGGIGRAALALGVNPDLVDPFLQ
ncbi:MAG: YdcF family protein, partial [Pseudomonadota bacterium]